MTAKSTKKLWFKAKSFGWGWYPASVEGWVIILAFVGYILFVATQYSPTGSIRDVWFVAQLAIAIAVLIIICYQTGEKPDWRWNGKPLRNKK